MADGLNIKGQQASCWDFLSPSPCLCSSVHTLKTEIFPLYCRAVCTPLVEPLISCLCWHVVHLWPFLMKLWPSWRDFQLSLWAAQDDAGEWVIHRPACCVAKERPSLLCFVSPPEASWPRIISGRKFAFWGSRKVADTLSYIERSFITLFFLSSPNSVLPLLCCFY